MKPILLVISYLAESRRLSWPDHLDAVSSSSVEPEFVVALNELIGWVGNNAVLLCTSSQELQSAKLSS